MSFNFHQLDQLDRAETSGTILHGRERLIDLVRLSDDCMTATLSLTRGKETIIDAGDLWLAQYRWCYYPSQHDPAGYGLVGRKGRRNFDEPRTVLMHRIILQPPPGYIVDHINGNPLDNRRSNLRIAKTQTNAFNKKLPDVPKTSRFKGVFMRGSDNGIWTARIKLSDKLVELGRYQDEMLAAMAYNEAAKLLFGDYARPNDLPESPPEWLIAHVHEKCRARINEAAFIVSDSLCPRGA